MAEIAAKEIVASVLAELAGAGIEKMKRSGETPPIDPNQVAKCVSQVMVKFLEEKGGYVKVISKMATIDPELLMDNLRKLSKGMKVSIEKKTAVLGVSIAATEYTYKFVW